MCQRLNTGESNNFYFGIFICNRPLNIALAHKENVRTAVHVCRCVWVCVCVCTSVCLRELVGPSYRTLHNTVQAHLKLEFHRENQTHRAASGRKT